MTVEDILGTHFLVFLSLSRFFCPLFSGFFLSRSSCNSGVLIWYRFLQRIDRDDIILCLRDEVPLGQART